MPPKHKRPTIKQVASLAGVSTQTVSRVLNNRPDVSAETRERVMKVIGDLGYQPSALARSLIQQRSYTLGVVIAGLKFIGPSRTLSGITNAAEECGYSLLLKELPRFDADNIFPTLQELISRHADGVIWAVPEVGENRDWLNDTLPELEVPILFLTMQPRPNIPVVSVDNYLGGKIAVQHLIEQGFRRIGHIAGPMDWWESRQRKQAWEDVLREAGIHATNQHWAEGNWSSSSGALALQKLYDQYPEMDSIFVGNDQMALGVIHMLAQKGLRVPQDIGIVGFDNIPESAYFQPPLTTVQQDQYAVAKEGVMTLLDIIENSRQGQDSIYPSPIMISPDLIQRQSSLRSR
jgi:DNA-binding LacI/PurR family transcriptional regulator